MADIYLDATGIPAGRLASYTSKRALLGDAVKILNCEKAIITGDKRVTFQKYHKRIRDIGQPSKGPFLSRMPDRFLRRIVRGMLDYKKQRGKTAFKKVMCYIGVPKEFADKKLEKLPVKTSGLVKYIYLEELCRALGARI